MFYNIGPSTERENSLVVKQSSLQLIHAREKVEHPRI
jgi:hypothetical protein